MIYHPLLLFAEQNEDRAHSMYKLWKLILVLHITHKFSSVAIQPSTFGGLDVKLVRSKNEDSIS
jgi:hypothetical protein